jgi:multidrug efflux pump subunit AcrB
MIGAAAILIALYVLLVVPFKSLIQPLYVMISIPFGIIGALIGHLLMNVTPSFLSAFGVLAVAGVVVNNAIIMMDFINQHRAAGYSIMEAAIESGVKRFRPIFLTSLTTFVGMVPTIFDSSIENQFLRPMAVSLAFGVVFATMITLFLIPSLYLITESARAKLALFWSSLGKKHIPQDS